jgi:uncharacterized membrane protein YcaP (DUF421 family)
MEPILRTIAIYVFLLVLFRLAGKRTIAETDTFDFVIILIISEATQQALVGEDFSLTTSLLVITTLIGCGVLLAYLKQRSKRLQTLMDGLPTVLVHEGRLLKERMDRLRIDEEDLLEAAQAKGIARLEQIDYAILQRNGNIAIIPLSDSSK